MVPSPGLGRRSSFGQSVGQSVGQSIDRSQGNSPCRSVLGPVLTAAACSPLATRGKMFSDGLVRDKAQGYVMLYEMLLGKGSIQGGGKLKVRCRRGGLHRRCRPPLWSRERSDCLRVWSVDRGWDVFSSGRRGPSLRKACTRHAGLVDPRCAVVW